MKNYSFLLLTLFSAGFYGQVGIGTPTPDNSSILHLDVTSLPLDGKKGFLGPKVALKTSVDQITIPNPATGLLVYNLGTGGLQTEGYHYWNGSEWRVFNSSSTITPSVQGLNCSDATFNPPTFISGAPYNGVMVIPYSGGNGGAYGAGTPVASTGNTGLSAKLRPGYLSNGNGELIYDLTGIPSQSSPNPAIFNISFLNQNCVAKLTGDILRVGEVYGYYTRILQSAMADGQYASTFTSDLPVIEGLRVDIRKITGGFTYTPYLYNTSSNAMGLNWQVEGYSSGITVSAAGNIAANSYLDVGQGNTGSWNPSTARVLKMNVVINKARWYRIEFYSVSDSQTVPTPSDYHNIRITIQRLQ
ncbi:hypothetical protein [Chryseobacterium oranimense]|uniref:hypothetical protein n=1 Tax=Chryseobacterium oranimense TaxID=421058 RepID=UPI0031E2D056